MLSSMTSWPDRNRDAIMRVESVTNVKSGDRCSVEPYINDPNSYASRRGHPNCCEKLEVLGVHRDGGMRPQFILPARKLHPSTRLAWLSASDTTRSPGPTRACTMPRLAG